jgi:hypothetical protein
VTLFAQRDLKNTGVSVCASVVMRGALDSSRSSGKRGMRERGKVGKVEAVGCRGEKNRKKEQKFAAGRGDRRLAKDLPCLLQHVGKRKFLGGNSEARPSVSVVWACGRGSAKPRCLYVERVLSTWGSWPDR